MTAGIISAAPVDVSALPSPTGAPQWTSTPLPTVGSMTKLVSSTAQVDERAGGHQPLVAPRVSPLMKCFCRAR